VFNAGSSVTGAAALPTTAGRIDALVVATAGGAVHALGCADGILLWSAVFEGPVTVAAGQNPVGSSSSHFLFFLEFMFCVAAQHRVFVLDSAGKRMHAMQPDNGTTAVHLSCFC
jgi:hypothetical protein